MTRSFAIAGVALLMALGAVVCVAQDNSAKVVTTSEAKAVATDGDEGPVITLDGKLQNAGTNYFTDRRIVLRDLKGEIHVQAWLPLTASEPETGDDKPEVLSDYLGKQVRLTGMVTKQPIKGVGLTEVLVVEHANVASK